MRVVTAAGVREPVYCLALRYTEDIPFPPTVDLGRVSDREAVLRGVAPALRPRMAWNPAEWPSCRAGEGELDVLADDPDLARLCTLANAALADDEDDEGERVRNCLAAVARRLLAHDWGDALRTTEDFLVYATELELSDLREAMELSLPPERLERLADEGLLPAR